MDELISKLYQKNIIIFKNITLKNGLITPIYVNFLKLFEEKFILNIFLNELNNFINENIYCQQLYGLDNLSKNICTLLNYKYNIENIIDINKNNDNDNNNLLILKENYGLSDKSKLKIKNKKIDSIIFLIKYGNIKELNINNLCFLDNIYILSTLYQKRILNHEKYFDYFKILFNILEIKPKKLKIKNIELKSRIIFDTIYIEKLDIKDFIKALDYICPHISLIKINMNNFSCNISSILKLLIYHNIIIIDYFNQTKINLLVDTFKDYNKNYKDFIINLLNIEDLLKPHDLKLDNLHKSHELKLYNVLKPYQINLDNLIIDNITIPEFFNTRLKLFNIIKSNNLIMGIITNQYDYIFDSKFKIGYYENSDINNNLEKKLLIFKYDLLITNNAKNIINLKQMINNIMH